MSLTWAPLLSILAAATAVLLGGMTCQSLGAPIGRYPRQWRLRRALTSLSDGADSDRLLRRCLAAAPELADCLSRLDRPSRERAGAVLRPPLQACAAAAAPAAVGAWIPRVLHSRRRARAERCLRLLAVLPSSDLAALLLLFAQAPDSRLAHRALAAIGRSPEHYCSTLPALAAILQDKSAAHRRIETAWAFRRVFRSRLESAPMLLNDMSPAIWPIVADSVRQLAVRSQDVVDALMRAVSDPHQACREAACVALTDVPDRRAFERLARAVHDQSLAVRLAATSALSRRADAASMATLIAAAATADERGLRAIDHALERMRGVPIESVLMGMGGTSAALSAPQIRSLALIGTPQTLPVLVPLLTDDSPAIRRAGAKSIAAIWRRTYPLVPDESVVTALLARFAVEKAPSVQAALIEAIECSADSRVSASLVGQIPLVDAALRERLVDATAMLGLLDRRRERSAAAPGGRARNGTLR